MYKNAIDRKQAFGATAANLTLSGQASEIYLAAKTNDCLFEFDGTASSASTWLPKDSPVCIPCNHPTSIGVIQAASAAAGTLYVIEFI